MPDPASGDADSARGPFDGITIAQCVVGARLGTGRTSHVYRAHNEKLGRDIAIKILSDDMADIEEIRERFLLEARAIAQLDQENVVKVIDVVEADGHMCILMELVEGETLQDKLKRDGALPPRKAVRIALETARALEAAHAAKVVHRDIKPGNLLLAGGTESVKVVDFGLAGPKTLAQRTGTPLYMSPEACQGKRIDEKSDVYALGVCLYQMLAGQLPYTGKSVRAILAAHIAADFVPPSEINDKLGTEYDDVCRKMMVASKGYRPSAAEAAEMLEPLVAASRTTSEAKSGGGRAGRRTSRAAPARQTKSAPKTGLIIAIVLFVVVGIVAAIVLTKKDKEQTSTAPEADPVKLQPVVGSNGATNGGGTPAADPVSTSVDAQLAAARDAFNEVEAWWRVNQAADKWEEAAKKWDAVANDHSGTDFGKQAATKATEARARAEQEKEIAAEAAARAEREKADLAVREQLNEALKLYDYAGAAKIAESHRNVGGETIADWRRKRARIDYLAEEFLERINVGLADVQVMAKVVNPDGGHDEVLKTADAEGLHSEAGGLPRLIPWKRVEPKAMFKLLTKFTSQSNYDGNEFLAIAAAEMGLDKRVRDHKDIARMLDETGTATERLRRYFDD